MTTHRPTVLSGTLAVLAGALAIGFVAGSPDQRFVLGVAVASLVPLATGLELRRRGHALLGLVLGALGTAGVGAAVGLSVTTLGSVTRTVEVVPGLLGLYVLVLGLGVLREGAERLLLSVGAGLLLISVVVSAAVYETELLGLLGGGVATILALDLAEQAVNLGEQVGREPKTRVVEAAHAGATVGVGVVAVTVTLVIVRADVTGVPLTVLAGLLGAGFTLAIALYN